MDMLLIAEIVSMEHTSVFNILSDYHIFLLDDSIFFFNELLKRTVAGNRL